MSLDAHEVKKIAHLARLAVDEADVQSYADDLSRILEFVETLEVADLSAYDPMAHPLDMSQRLRADEVSEPDQRDHFQAIAPATEAGLYLVPRVIE